MSSRIEQIIDEIEEYIDHCKFQPLSTTKIIVNKDQIDELLRELRMKTPEEIKRYQKIIDNKDAIIADAQTKADSMIEEAKAKTDELVSDHEIMQQAYARRMRSWQPRQSRHSRSSIMRQRTQTSSVWVRWGYADDMMAKVENLIGHALDNYTTKYDSLVNSLQESFDMVHGDREELRIQDETETEFAQAMEE